MDVVRYRKEYGRTIGMTGGFDKRILAGKKSAIKAEGRTPAPRHRGRRLHPQLRPQRPAGCLVGEFPVFYGMLEDRLRHDVSGNGGRVKTVRGVPRISPEYLAPHEEMVQ